MAEITPTSVVRRLPVGNLFLTVGRASVTSAGGYISKEQLGLSKLESGLVSSAVTNEIAAAVRNSQAGTEDSHDGDLWLDVESTTQTVSFFAYGRP